MLPLGEEHFGKGWDYLDWVYPFEGYRKGWLYPELAICFLEIDDSLIIIIS